VHVEVLVMAGIWVRVGLVASNLVIRRVELSDHRLVHCGGVDMKAVLEELLISLANQVSATGLRDKFFHCLSLLLLVFLNRGIAGEPITSLRDEWLEEVVVLPNCSVNPFTHHVATISSLDFYRG
jgi:hypothetical protein